ncbi:MAG: cobalamin-independent methionine synthase II family protein [Salinivenus sp.]
MTDPPIRTTVIGSYPFPSWLQQARRNLDAFGTADVDEMQEDAVVAALHDQRRAGLDVVTDGEQTRFDFNLSFYGYLEGIRLEQASERKWGPPAHDQRPKHTITGELRAPDGLGAVEEFERLRRLAPPGPSLKACLPGPYTLSGRLTPNDRYPDRYAVAEALLPIVQRELDALVEAGCPEIQVDEPSMSCYAHKADTGRLVDLYNRTVEPVVGRCRLTTHLCFGNYKGHAVGRRRLAPMFPDFLDLKADELHVEMANREFAEIEVLGTIAEEKDVAVGVVDVKNYYVETPDDVARRIRRCLDYVPADQLSVAPDCGLSQTARWAARRKLNALVEGAHQVRSAL